MQAAREKAANCGPAGQAAPAQVFAQQTTVSKKTSTHLPVQPARRQPAVALLPVGPLTSHQ